MRSAIQLWCAPLAATFLVAAQAPQVASNVLESERQLASDRYARVASELLDRDLAGLSPEQRAARANLLVVLDAYRTRADYGITTTEPDARVPLFVDGEGRRCAMAELLHATGRDDLVGAVQAANNRAWIVDLAGHAPLLGWLEQNGLALDEAARIQGPGMVNIGNRGPREVVPERARGGNDNSGASTPSTPGPSTPGPAGPSTPGVGGPSTPGSSPTPGPSMPAGDAFTWTEDAASWWMWWEFNKIEFLRPNRVIGESADDGGATGTSYLAFVRSVMKPAVLHALEDRDPAVRGAAALTLGRIGGADAVEPLLGLVQDANEQVRQLAILGLGATGSPRAQGALLTLARTERLPGETRMLGSDVQPLAVIALGIGRKIGFDASVDAEIVELLGVRSLADRETLGVAAMMYATLAPTDMLRAAALDLAHDNSEPISVRCRAIEALRGATDGATLSKLQHLLSGPRVELRRSAALALGEYEHALVVPALQTAYDLEKDQLARGFLLISLGRQASEAARKHLFAELTNGPKPLRPWAALGLGLVAHKLADDEIATALRAGALADKNADARAAYWLASGLAGDVKAIEPLASALARDAAPRNRMYAATALALIGGDAAHAKLLARVSEERSEIARSALALGLGVLGRDGDARVIADVLAATSDPALQGQVSSAMAFHGSSDALVRTNAWVASDELARATRAAALDGLGMMLGSCEPLTLGELARSANYTQFASWTMAMLETTL